MRTILFSFLLFLSALSISQNTQWVKEVITEQGVSQDDEFYITTDKSNCLYVCGTYSGVCDFDPGISSTTLNANGISLAIVKYSANGQLVY